MGIDNSAISTITISVRELVEFSAREGDLVSDSHVGVSAIEGIKGHQYVQKRRDHSWVSECPVNSEIELLGVRVQLAGRIDLMRPKDMVSNAVVEEIKVGLLPIESIPIGKLTLHKAQVKVYAYLFSQQYKELCDDTIEIKTTWFNYHKRSQSSQSEFVSVTNLCDYVLNLLHRYVAWFNAVEKRFQCAVESAKTVNFPFPRYRDNQLEFSRYVYRCIRDQESLLLQAPTGTGKTVSVLFPAIKSLAILDSSERPQVYFLTCKNSGQRPALESLTALRNSGFQGAFLQLQAKQRMCPCKSIDDTPESGLDSCSRCIGFYDRLPSALDECIAQSDLSVSVVQTIADEFHICPYELSRQLVGCVPIILGDINYVFDPLVGFSQLKSQPRNNNRIFLMDEVHNLPGRARNMYSASLDIEKLDRFLKKSKRALGKAVVDYGAKLRLFVVSNASALSEIFTADDDFIDSDLFKQFFCLIDELTDLAYHALENKAVNRGGNSKDDDADFLLEFLWDLHRFTELLHACDKGTQLVWRDGQQLALNCLSAAGPLSHIMSLGRVAIGFSGTLTPLEFYAFETGFDQIENKIKCLKEPRKHKSLRTSSDDSSYPMRLLSLPSPFDDRNQLTLITDFVDYSYQNRILADIDIAGLIVEVCGLSPGKYLVYAPSFESLENIFNRLSHCDFNAELIKQTRGESEAERSVYLDTFASEPSVVGLAVLGGVYSEALTFEGGVQGVFVVGTGISAPSQEQEYLRGFYQSSQYDGFAFTYFYPGFTKVQQAVGRLIRSEVDRGVVILVDSRFNQPRYKTLMPGHWKPIACQNLSEIKTAVRRFWLEGTSEFLEQQ